MRKATRWICVGGRMERYRPHPLHPLSDVGGVFVSAEDYNELERQLQTEIGTPIGNLTYEEISNCFAELGKIKEIMESYRTGSGSLLTTHKKNPECKKFGCVIHNPSDHCMKDFPTHWRADRNLMERICPHGVGHPDPDHISYIERKHGPEIAEIESMHGCDGCCVVKITGDT